MIDSNPIISIIILYAKATNTPNKKQRWSDWKNKDWIMCCSQEIHLTYKNAGILKAKIQKKSSSNEKACLALLTSDKIAVPMENIIRIKKGIL